MRLLGKFSTIKEKIFNNINISVVALKESFIMMIPFLLLMSTLIMIVQGLNFFELDKELFHYDLTLSLAIQVQKLFPLLLMISITYNLAHLLDIHKLLSIFSSMIIYILFIAYDSFMKNEAFILEAMLSVKTILIPILSTYTIYYVNQWFSKGKDDAVLYKQLQIAFGYFIPFVIALVVTVSTIYFLEYIFYYPIHWLQSSLNGLSDFTFMLLKTIYAHLSWFFGIHGSVSSAMVFDSNVLSNELFANLTNKEFYDLFVIYGGSGAGLSLAIAILVYGKNKAWNKVSKLALPFVTFNINEILIYGLPIVLNKLLLIPFLLVPITNFLIAYFVLSLGYIEFVDVSLHWTTPVLINSYILTDGNIFAMLLQLSLIILGIFIYIPFIHKYTQSQSYEGKVVELKKKLDIFESLQSTSCVSFSNSQATIIKKNIEVDKIIEMIGKNKLFLFYQPKVDLINMEVDSCEALIRLEIDGKIVGPYFIEELEDYGLSYIIDTWVCTQVKKDIEKMKKNFLEVPKISINISPDTLQNKALVEKIISILKGHKVSLEILERGFLDYEKSGENIELLLKNNIEIVVDDFGVGYSGFGML
jgi:lactose/cellobiose-specific phosphotransferase system IIC component